VNRVRRVWVYVLACTALVVLGGLLAPLHPNVMPIQGFIAAFPNDRVTIVIPYRFPWWNFLGRTPRIAEIDLASSASVISYSVDRSTLFSGTINILIRPDDAQDSHQLKEAKFRYAQTWHSVHIGDVNIEIIEDTGDRSLLLSEGAIIRHSRFEEPYEMAVVNVSQESVSVLDVGGRGITYLGEGVVLEPGTTAVLAVNIDPNYKMARPWILYRTSVGEHMMPGAACYRIVAGTD